MRKARPVFSVNLFAQVPAIGGDDLLVPVEAVLGITAQILQVELVPVDVDKAVPLLPWWVEIRSMADQGQ